MRYFAIISYNGTTFFGWQKQTKSDNTVQHHIDKTLSTLLRKDINSMGCGRTDTGVHASGFYLHFDVIEDFEVDHIIYKMNQILPSSIVVHDIFKVKDELHSRFHAISRSYVYRIKNYKDPFDKIHYYCRSNDINVEKLNEVASLLIEKSDFSAYCKTQDEGKTTFCTITQSEWKIINNTFEYHITANRFLRGMIRLLVGMMLNYERGKISIESIEASFNEKSQLPYIWSVPSDGLILHKILYNENLNLNEDRISKTPKFV